MLQYVLRDERNSRRRRRMLFSVLPSQKYFQHGDSPAISSFFFAPFSRKKSLTTGLVCRRGQRRILLDYIDDS